MKNARIIFDELVAGGLTRNQAMGVMGNLLGESHDKGDVNTRGFNAGEGAFGVAQWRNERRVALNRFADGQGLSADDPRAQARFILQELNTTEKAAGQRLRAAQTVDEAAGAFIGFERPGGWKSNNPTWAPDLPRRQRWARTFSNVVNGGDSLAASYAPSDPTPAPNVIGTDSNVTLTDAVAGEVKSNKEVRLEENVQQDTSWSTAGAIWEAVKHENMVGWMLEGVKGKNDPDFNAITHMESEDEAKRLKSYPPEMQKDLVWSSSKDDYERKLRNMDEEITYQKKMGELGWKGTAAQMLGAAADPAGWALAVLSPLSGGAVKLSRVGRILALGAEGAAGNVIADLPQAAERPGFQKEQLLYSAAGGFAFAAGLGAIFKPRPDIAPEIQGMINSSHSLQREIEARAGAGGAAPNFGDVRPVYSRTDDFLSPEFDAAAPTTAMAKARFDLVGRTAKEGSDPLSRSLIRHLVEDGVGASDGSVGPRAASVEANRINLTNLAWYAREYSSAWDDYVKRNKVGWRDRGAAERQFNEDITRATVSTDPAIASAFDPAVQKMAGHQRDWYANYLRMAQNPGELDGTVRAPLKGFEEVNPNDHYVPRIHDKARFDEFVHRFGDNQIVKLVRESIYNHFDTLPRKMADQVANAFYKGLREASIGGEVHLSAALSGFNREALRDLLGAGGSMSKEEINKVLEKLKPKETGTTNARGKRRTPMNIDHEVMLKDRTTGQVVPVKVSDWTVKDAKKIAHMYSRTMSADIALSRMRIENPRWREGDPDADRWLVDGVRSASDWSDLMQTVRDVANQKGVDVHRTEENIKRMSFAYDMMKGKLDDWEKGRLGTLSRIVRDWNFTRVMNQVGFAQVPEIGVAISQVGLKTAFRAMPEFRKFMRDVRTGELPNELARELEWASAYGTDSIRSRVFVNHDPWDVVHEAEGKLGAVEKFSKRAAHVTSHISGMQGVNTMLQRYSMKLIAAKFAMAAEGATELNMKRMAVLGIGEEEAQAIFGQIKKHASFVEEEGSKLRRLNLQDWDPGTRYVFEHALFSWSRRMIQENDIGQMNTVLGTGMGKLMFQFRSFMIGAYTKNLLHNISTGTAYENAMAITLQTTIGAMTYAAQTHLQAVGRSDREKFLEERLGKDGEWGKLARAGFQRAGYSSIVPAVADVATYALGMDPLFNTRVTGTPSQGITSNPTTSLIDNIMRTGRAIGSTVTKGSPITQNEVRGAVSLLPFSNFLPVVMGLNAAISGLPEKEPKSK